jgi:acyl-coenzyme A synthetase/AMP-(fatty) acid ligase
MSSQQLFRSGRLGIYRDDPQAREHLEHALAYLNQSFIFSKFLPFQQLYRQVKWHFNMITADDRVFCYYPSILLTLSFVLACLSHI